ncbi:glutamate--tRNA ligase [Sandaracinobacter sp. RS1-74]|uniref:glutamate--tRNA ligase n=1 Tax=Sandaracinobacteroides sayramensis TaxID=2913411 RepID=UPI001EDA04B4|nr:glutamate--tRNA ligase [Sandaracinobacteroides sayramensis]MCG2842170.1 glutamate--tRNA ligase [Sandaracinobacteroides sayramensis]
MIVTRFAPSPTGRLHVGNVRTALLNWLLARQAGGRFLLRLDDTDTARSTEEYAQSIREDLAWLGMDPDTEEKQSARMARYEEVLDQLAAAGHVYRAYETPEELELKRKVLLGRGLPPVYDRAALALTNEDHARFEAEGRKPHWRFRLDPALPREWTDLVRGPSHIDPASLSDPVIRRADGSWLYMLPSVIDDVDMRITHVVRGEDHVTNTGIQLQMFAAMGAPAPLFGHAALLTGAEGALSKRLGSIGVADFRARGIEPIAVKALLARLGTSLPVEPVTSDAPLLATFDIGNLGRAAARFDEAELERLNASILHQTAHAAIAGRTRLSEAEWNAVRGNIASVAEAEQWKAVITGPIEAPAQPEEDKAFLHEAAAVLESQPFGPTAWADLTEALKAKTGRKGKSLFMPLRLALTAQPHGPDMAALLPLIGREEALTRLKA